jgi:hypothetical protein
MHVAD